MKKNPYEYLEKLKDNPNIYISYIGSVSDVSGEHPKLGINPKSHYNTPLGVYTYPLKEIWGPIEETGRINDVPFSGDKPFIAVLEVKEDMNFINDMYSDYDSSNYDEDIDKLKNKLIPTTLTNEEFNMLVNHALNDAIESNPMMSMWNIVRFLSYCTVELNKKHTPRHEVLENIEDENIKNIKNIGLLNLYGLTFNRLLQDTLGYDGFADKTGKGYIHKSEPTQAVFLNPAAYNVLTILKNNTDAKSVHDNGGNKTITKINKLIQSGSLSPKAWFQLLKGFNRVEVLNFWEQCPYDDIKNDPEILAKINNPKLKQNSQDFYLKELVEYPEKYSKLPEMLKMILTLYGNLKKNG